MFCKYSIEIKCSSTTQDQLLQLLKLYTSNELSPAIDQDAELSWIGNSHSAIIKTKYITARFKNICKLFSTCNTVQDSVWASTDQPS